MYTALRIFYIKLTYFRFEGVIDLVPEPRLLGIPDVNTLPSIRLEPGRAFWGADYEEVHTGDHYKFLRRAMHAEPMFIRRMTLTTYQSLYTHEYIPLEDEHEFPAERNSQLPPIDSPTTDSPGYVSESDPMEDPCFTTTHTDITVGLGLLSDPKFVTFHQEANVERLLSMDLLPSPSPPISLSPPSAGERLARCMAPPAHSPPLPPSSGCLTQIQTLRIASTQALIDAVTAALPPPPLPPLPPSLSIPSPVDHRDDIPESEQPPRKRLHLSTIYSRYEVGESSTARPARGQGTDYGFVSTVDAEERRQGIRDVGYGIRDTWVDPAEAVPEIAPMTVGEVNTRVTELAELHERDTQDLYALLEDAQDSRSHISQRVDVDSQRVDLLITPCVFKSLTTSINLLFIFSVVRVCFKS
ncbi:hypothetical protein Tco_0597109 [Tanacetum coccineum]